MRSLSSQRPVRTLLFLGAIIASLLALPSAQGQTVEDLDLRIEDGLLVWDQIPGADHYLLADAYTEVQFITAGTSATLPSIVTGDDVSVTVAAVSDGALIAVQRLRGGADDLLRSAEGTPTVQEGMRLLASTRVRTTPGLVEFTLPDALLSVIEGWSLYRDGELIASPDGNQATAVDGMPSPGASYGYTVVLSAPDWTSVKERLQYRPAIRQTCDALERVCLPVGEPATESHDVETDEQSEVGKARGDHLSFTLPIEVPDLGPAGMLLAAADSRTGASDDNAHIRHFTFIEDKLIDVWQPPGQPDYWFGGDSRGFSDRPFGSFRTYVRAQVDWKGSQLFYNAAVGTTRRYINRGGKLFFDAEKTATNNPTVEVRDGGQTLSRPRSSLSGGSV